MASKLFKKLSKRDRNLVFFQACHGNNLDEVNDCLSRGCDVNTKGDWYGSQWTGLMVACERGNPAIVSRLVQVPGLDINYQDEKYGDNAAHGASLHGHTECLRILAETGRVDWNQREKYGRTPLYLAIWYRHPDIVDIITHQPNIDYHVKSTRGYTLAQAAVWKGGIKCVETLANKDSFDGWNFPLTGIKRTNGNCNCDHCAMGCSTLDGDTPVMLALKQEKSEIVKILLRCPRVDLSCRDKDGWSLVFRAIQKKKIGDKIKQR